MTNRDAKQATLRAAMGKCPCCGEGRLYRRYLNVHDTCSVCGTSLDLHNADDAPTWITLTVVLHLVAPFVAASALDWQWSLVTGWIVWPLVTLILCLITLPIAKGSIIGYQWAKRLAGFR